MRTIELEAMRLGLGLSQAECAKHIIGVSRRSWQYWEQGERKIPKEVEDRMFFLFSLRDEKIEFLKKHILNNIQNGQKTGLIFYSSKNKIPEDHLIITKVWNSAVILLLNLFKNEKSLEIIKFDDELFLQYLDENKKLDNEESRCEWADSIAQSIKRLEKL